MRAPQNHNLVDGHDKRSRFVVWGLLTLIVLAALGIRIFGQIEHVFVGGETYFQETDPWCHMRQVDALVRTFPGQNSFDVYGAWPGGLGVPVAPFFDWILAAVILVIGLGHPSQMLVDQVGAYFPAVLGAMVPLACYHVARLLLNRVAGIAAAVLAAFAPGQLLVRSLLGYTDHHAMESLLSGLIMWSVVAFLAQTRGASRDADDEANGRRAVRVERLRWLAQGVVTALVLAIYLLSWTGGSIVVGILVAWLCIQYIADCTAERDTVPLVCLGLPLFSLPLLVVTPYAGRIFGMQLQVYGLLLGVGAVCVLSCLAWILRRTALGRRWYLVFTIGFGVLGLVVLRVAAPSAFNSVVGQFGFFDSDRSVAIREALPLLRGDAAANVWREFGPALFAAALGFVFLAIRVFRRLDSLSLFVLLWTIAMAAVTLGQVRFSYYLGVNVVILAGVAVGEFFTWLWSRALQPVQATAGERLRQKSRKGERLRGGRHVRSGERSERAGRLKLAVVLSLAVIVSMMWPTLRLSIAAAGKSITLNADWREAMTWLRENTPEPFGDPDVYYAYYGEREDCLSLLESRSAYGVLGWWDCGYWIMRMGHRIPVSNPTQHAAGTVARFMTAQDEAAAAEIAQECEAKYVVLDVELPAWQPTNTNVLMGKFESLVSWCGEKPSRFYEFYYHRENSGEFVPVVLYYPEYYRTLISRLYVCRGQAYEPKDVHVVTFREGLNEDGETIKELMSLRRFATSAEAEAYMTANVSGACRVVGVSPFYPCVPLEAMREFRLVHQSPTIKGRRSGQEVKYVEIYEFCGHIYEIKGATAM